MFFPKGGVRRIVILMEGHHTDALSIVYVFPPVWGEALFLVGPIVLSIELMGSRAAPLFAGLQIPDGNVCQTKVF